MKRITWKPLHAELTTLLAAAPPRRLDAIAHIAQWLAVRGESYDRFCDANEPAIDHAEAKLARAVAAHVEADAAWSAELLAPGGVWVEAERAVRFLERNVDATTTATTTTTDAARPLTTEDLDALVARANKAVEHPSVCEVERAWTRAFVEAVEHAFRNRPRAPSILERAQVLVVLDTHRTLLDEAMQAVARAVAFLRAE